MDNTNFNNQTNLRSDSFSRMFFCYLAYMLWVVVIEWINFIPKFFLETNLPFGVAEVCAAFIILCLWLLLRKYISFAQKKVNIEVIIGILLVLGIGYAFSIYPDGCFDTYNYHLIAQNPQFENYFVEDFGYGNFQVWGFRLCDRMFYYFRLLFGFRIGTMLNAVSLAISFEQVYFLLDFFDKRNSHQIEKHNIITNVLCNKMLWSLAIIFSLDAVMMLGTYYVDVITMPIGINVLRRIIETADEEISSKDIYSFALLCGLWIGGKLTNVIYVFPCVLAFIILHVKKFRIKDWIISVVLGVCTYVEYLIWNYKCTKNPFFPYYNTIFKSPYYSLTDFKDARWGGETSFEKIFWIIYAVFKPEYRQSEIFDTHTLLLALGLLSTIVLLVSIIVKVVKAKKIDNQYSCLFCIAIMSTLLWGFTTGYSRYFIIGRCFYGIIAFVVINRIYHARFEGNLCTSWKILGKVLTGIVTAGILINGVATISYSWVQGGWGWIQRNGENFAEQSSKVFFDRNVEVTENIDFFALTSGSVQGLAELIEPDAYSFYIPYICNDENYGMQLLKEAFEKYSFGYDIHQRNYNDIQEYIDMLNSYQLYIKNIEEISIPVGTERFELIALESANGRENTLWNSNQGSISINTDNLAGGCSVSFWAGFTYDWEIPAVEIIFKSNNNIIAEIEIDTKNIKKYESMFFIPENVDNLTMEARYVDSGEKLETGNVNYCFVSNLQLVQESCSHN